MSLTKEKMVLGCIASSKMSLPRQLRFEMEKKALIYLSQLILQRSWRLAPI